MAKKRKETPPSVTLDSFFQKSGTSSNKKPKLRSSSTAAQRVTKKPRPFNVSPEDIIVIDDDDDQHAVLTVESSSDIEILEDTPADVSLNASTSTRGGPSSSRPSFHKARDVGSIDLPTSFGVPSLLMHEQTDPQVEEGPDFGAPMFLDPDEGASTSTLGKPAEPSAESQDGLGRPSLDPLQRCDSNEDALREGTSYAQKPIADSTPADQWELGDDEADIVENELLPEEAEVADIEPPTQEHSADSDNSMQTCPICNGLLEKMSALEIQTHVNSCIDSVPSSSMPKVTPGPSPKPSESPSKILRPVSSYQTLNVLSDSQDDVKPDISNAAHGESGTGAFSVLMNSHKENEAWKEAAVAEDRNFRPTKANGGRRKAPFYKVLQGMPIAVDAFRYGAIPGVTAYFLTHAHSDHYTNLSGNWKHGPIYCSEGTANLIVHMLGVDRKWVHALPMDVPTVLPDTGGVSVTPIEANHCPGSCLFLFEGYQTVNAGDSAYKSPYVGSKRTFRYLHCGDFRASPQHVLHPAVKGKKIDHVYLDTTYLDPKYCFPPQSEVISACAELARRIVAGESLAPESSKKARVDGWFTVKEKSKDKGPSKAGKTLVIVGTYSIGKERIVKAIAKALGTKIYSDARKRAILRCQADSELDALLTSDPLEAGVHLLPLGVINSDRLKLYLEQWDGHFTKAVGFRPTGWTFTPAKGTDSAPAIPAVIAKSQAQAFTFAHIRPMKASTGALQLFGVPYSEHSSFFELTCFALSLDWARMIATVNVGSEASRAKMAKWVERWEAERRKRGKVEVVSYRAPDYW